MGADVSENQNILCRLRMELDTEELDYRKSSLLQGVLFEKMDPSFAAEMHSQQMHPYSMSLVKEEGKTVWYVNTISRKAYDNIVVPLLGDGFSEFIIKHNEINVGIRTKDCEVRPYSDLIEGFYGSDTVRYLKLRLLTLTSFRQRGHYNIIPDLRLIYQSLMLRYSSVAENSSMVDEETLMQLEDSSIVTSYRMRSGLFPVEGQKIPGYMGEMTIRLNGTDTMGRYARMLFQFGEYSGLGVKTGMGMGAMRLI